MSEALEAAANATIKIVFLVIIGVIATANGTCVYIYMCSLHNDEYCGKWISGVHV